MDLTEGIEPADPADQLLARDIGTSRTPIVVKPSTGVREHTATVEDHSSVAQGQAGRQLRGVLTTAADDLRDAFRGLPTRQRARKAAPPLDTVIDAVSAFAQVYKCVVDHVQRTQVVTGIARPADATVAVAVGVLHPAFIERRERREMLTDNRI